MKTIIVFDLDDTLYNEIDFLKSAFYEIASFLDKENSFSLYARMFSNYRLKRDVFRELLLEYPFMDKDILLYKYRNHKPKISLRPGVKKVLDNLKIRKDIKLGLITDGRTLTQKNKIQALNIYHYFDDIIISQEFGSEKPSINNYKYFTDKYKNCNYIYIGDNFSKDFITPNKLNWDTIGIIDNGVNIHLQNFSLDSQYIPKRLVKNFENLNL